MRCDIVNDGMLSFSNLSSIIVQYGIIAVFILVGSVGIEHTLYTDISVSCLPSQPLIVMKDNRPNPWLSSPLFVFLDRINMSIIFAMPPDL